MILIMQHLFAMRKAVCECGPEFIIASWNASGQSFPLFCGPHGFTDAGKGLFNRLFNESQDFCFQFRFGSIPVIEIITKVRSIDRRQEREGMASSSSVISRARSFALS